MTEIPEYLLKRPARLRNKDKPVQVEQNYPWPSYANTLVVPKDVRRFKNATEALNFAKEIGYIYVLWNHSIWYMTQTGEADILYVKKRLNAEDLYKSADQVDFKFDSTDMGWGT